MTRFSKLSVDEHGNVTETEVREVSQSDIAKCPHVIFVPDHYRPDGSCRCNDPTHADMAEWGYEWHDGLWRSPTQ